MIISRYVPSFLPSSPSSFNPSNPIHFIKFCTCTFPIVPQALSVPYRAQTSLFPSPSARHQPFLPFELKTPRCAQQCCKGGSAARCQRGWARRWRLVLLLWRGAFFPVLSLPFSIYVSCVVRFLVVFAHGRVVTEDDTSGLVSCRQCRSGCSRRRHLLRQEAAYRSRREDGSLKAWDNGRHESDHGRSMSNVISLLQRQGEEFSGHASSRRFIRKFEPVSDGSPL
jgi:hypothetical protein